jgi:hypothetical protein
MNAGVFDLLEELEDKCKAHDWYYEYSDDYSVWKKGQAKAVEIRSIVSKLERLGARTSAMEILAKYAPQ